MMLPNINLPLSLCFYNMSVDTDNRSSVMHVGVCTECLQLRLLDKVSSKSRNICIDCNVKLCNHRRTKSGR